MQEKQNYHIPARVGDSWNNNYIKNESNDDRNKALLIEEYLNRIIPYLKDIINDLKTYSKDNDEEYVMYSRSDNIEIIINVKADIEVIEEFFQSLVF